MESLYNNDLDVQKSWASSEKIDDNQKVNASQVIAGYDRDVVRAEIREEVRGIVNQAKKRWMGCPIIEGEIKNFATLDVMMKFGSLATLRRLYYYMNIAGRLMIGMGLSLLIILVCQFADSNIFPSDVVRYSEIIASQSIFFGILGSFVLPFIDLFYKSSENKLNNYHNKYLGAVGRYTRDLAIEINTMVDGIIGGLNDGKDLLKDNATDDEGAERVRDGIRKTMKNWRILERIPFYLRNEWNEYFNDVMNERELPKNIFWNRIFPRFLDYLIFGGSAVFLLLSGLYVLVTSPKMSSDFVLIIVWGQIALLITIVSLMLLFAWKRRKRQVGRLRMPTQYIILGCAILLLLVTAYATFSAPSNRDLVFSVLVGLGAYVGGTSIAGLFFSQHAARTYKKLANICVVSIINALKTHKKRSVIETLSVIGVHSVRDYNLLQHFTEFGKKPENSNDDSWDDWRYQSQDTNAQSTDDEAALTLTRDEVERNEIIADAADVRRYVGNEGNLRVKITRNDPTTTLMNNFPYSTKTGK